METDKKLYTGVLDGFPNAAVIDKESAIKLCEMAYAEGKFDGMLLAMSPLTDLKKL